MLLSALLSSNAAVGTSGTPSAGSSTTSGDPSDTSSISTAADLTVTETGTSESATPGPDASGPAAFGLCTAWKHGGLSAEEAAAGNAPSQNLITAAGGADQVKAYCATVLPGQGLQSNSSVSTSAATHGKPAAKPTNRGKPGAHRPAPTTTVSTSGSPAPTS